MDGDIAPLTELAEIARRSGCRLMVDEAHATGCIGPGGRGSVAAAGLTGEVDVVMGTLGKALGGYGAYICGSRELTDYLVNAARPFIFSTALPPSVAAAAIAALDLISARPKRVERLRSNATALRDGLEAEGLRTGASETQIVPVIVGEADHAIALTERLLDLGILAQAVRPPTVPAGTCRLRLTAMATHRVGELRKAAKVIGNAARELGVATRGGGEATVPGIQVPEEATSLPVPVAGPEPAVDVRAPLREAA
jgi:7-keto-8-aminopelargonate synthetase-like enzyme